MSITASVKKNTAIKIGILGGGQLGRMLALKAHQLGFDPWILSEMPIDPAAQVCRNWVQGSGLNLEDLSSFLEKVDYLTFESEFFNTEIIARACSQKTRLQIFPSLSSLGVFQDRRTQKEALVSHNIKTAKFVAVDKIRDLEGLWRLFNEEFLLKKAQGGYDGYGTFFIKGASDLHAHQEKWNGPYIAEQKLRFHRELAAVLFRTSKGELASLPLVETLQNQARCDYVVGPIVHPEWPLLQEKFFKMLHKMDYVGALAVEMFETSDGLVVNELAPRVHNSGHHSQDTFQMSQFELHLRSGLGLDLQIKPLSDLPFVMVNLIGKAGYHFDIAKSKTGQLHWYGKNANREGRKMGHINFMGSNKKELLETAIESRRKLLVKEA